jgi:hypothetical protein
MFQVILAQVTEKGFFITPDQYTAMIERLVRIETLLSNHLHSSEMLLEKLVYPLVIGMVLLLFKGFWPDVKKIIGKK